MKRLLILFFITAVISPSVFAQKGIQFQDITFDQAMAEAAKTNKIIFVSVENQSQSPTVLKAEKEVFTIDSIADYFNKHCIPIRVNMSSEEGKKFAPHLEMLMYPVFVFHDATGDQLSFLNPVSASKDPGALMAMARESVKTAAIKKANTRSITFEKPVWKDLLAKAKKENKLIFVDSYTTWCRPCIQMAKDVFTLNKVADFYNKNFINVSMNMEKGDGIAVNKKYDVQAYPAFLFVNGDGELVYKDGGFMEADSFIEVGQKALDKTKKMSK